MLSLFPPANKYTLQIRKDHIEARDRALCVPLSADNKSSKAIASLSQLPTSDVAIQDGDLEILSCTLQELVSGIAERKWTSTRVLHAFIRSARRAHQKINCITQPNFAAALKAAEQRDEHFASTGELVGPLHGIPFSFKENNNIKGLPTTVGYTAWVLDGPATSDSALAQMVQHLGGIVILKTNVPQTMMSFECSNPLFGRTLNPWSAAHTPGGSSGGEAALLASDGAAAGFGSDIGGSLRIPTGYCGIYAIKPTLGRLPGAGTRTARSGFEGIPCVYAPMCRSTADLQFLFRELVPLLHPPLDSHVEPHEAQKKFGSESLRPSPLRPAWFDPIKVSEARRKPLRIGYYFCDGYIKTSPACMRGVKESVEALQASPDYKDGKLELVEIDPARLDTVEAMHIFSSHITSDRCDGLLAPLKSRKIREAMDFALFLPVFAARGAAWMKKILYWIVKYVIGDKALGYLLTAGGGKTASQYFDHVARRDKFRAAFRKKVWDFYQLDGIICPVQASPAVPHGGCTKLSTMASSTILYNVLDTAVTICPVTRVNPQLDAVSHKGSPPPAGSTDAQRGADEGGMTLSRYQEWDATPGFSTCSKMNSYSLYGEGTYDAVQMAGLPIGVQVVAREHEEEKSIGLLRLLDEALKQSRREEKAHWGPGLFTRLAMESERKGY